MFKYRYERLLGEGTNGKTYLATDLRTGSLLAIKALKLNQIDNFKSFELFKREAETLASLNVTGVPKFYESILAEEIGGECYIVQEYIHAPSIQSYLNDKRIFTEEETLTLMLKTAEILNILHSQYSPPVIHRDIKPSNILCDLPNDKNWKNIHPYLIDFGAVANAHSNTDKSTIAGTIGYMAPEQNFGECLPQTDLYALGATALHMLTGVPPYEMDFDTFSLKYEEALDAHAPKTSPEMRKLLGSLLNYSYDSRPPSADALIKEINKILTPDDATEPQIETQNLSFLQRIELKLAKRFNQQPKPEQMPPHFFEQLNPPYPDHTLLRYCFGTVRHHDDFVNIGDYNIPFKSYQRQTEYTFEAEGICWAGCEHDAIAYQPNSAKTPFYGLSIDPLHPASLDDALTAESIIKKHYLYATSLIPKTGKCIVLYHANDPSCNRLLYILPPEKQNSQKTTKQYTSYD